MYMYYIVGVIFLCSTCISKVCTSIFVFYTFLGCVWALCSG